MTKEQFISALKKAEEAAKSMSNVEDTNNNSCCNFDEVYFKMPEGVKFTDVKSMVNENGKPLVTKMKKDFYWFNPVYNGQAERRKKIAEAAATSFEESGIIARVHYQMD